MARLTRVQRSAIERALVHARRAHKYIFQDNVAVCRRGHPGGGTTLDYRRNDGAVLSEVEKHYGSDLTGLDDSIRELQRFLEDYS